MKCRVRQVRFALLNLHVAYNDLVSTSTETGKPDQSINASIAQATVSNSIYSITRATCHHAMWYLLDHYVPLQYYFSSHYYHSYIRYA